MSFKIRDILLVSSLYDNYLFEEDGKLYELIREEYHSLNLSNAPELTHVTTAQDAIDLNSAGKRFDLIITTMHIEDMHVIDFAKLVRSVDKKIPLILLAYDNQERKEIAMEAESKIFDRVFIWQGDYRLLMGIIKYVEDKLNVEKDVEVVGVQSIILVEDDVKFYSSYLPLIYSQVFEQSQALISEGVKTAHRFLRMRARPKILLCTTYEEAWDYFEKYQRYILGVISDIRFLHNGKNDSKAGIKLAKAIKAVHEDIPILLQSSQAKHEQVAYDIGASFLLKNSPRLLKDLRSFLKMSFSFGDFVFKTSDGKEVGRAHNLRTLEKQLAIVPDDSIEYHSERNHFSSWLKARTEFWLARHLRANKVSDFNSITEMRNHLISNIKMYRDMRQRGTITEFNRETFDPKNSFAKIGNGSLGGKARGLGFINTLLTSYALSYKFDKIDIYVPSAIVLATDVFDSFMEENDLFSFAITEQDDEVILTRFLEAERFPSDVVLKLIEYLNIVRVPLAVRSSSLLEDSQFQPFAGIYSTYMIPNKDDDLDVRLDELIQTIKLVFASTFLKSAKNYLKVTSYRLEEEKMAVIIQKIVGTQHNERFYPEISGVAKSYNFYPIAPQESHDGIVSVALGLGKTVVEGGNTVRFCPKYPKHLMQFFSTADTMKNAQQEFYALDDADSMFHGDNDIPDNLLRSYDLTVAEEDGTLRYVGSTYSAENNAVYDGTSREGSRIVTFAPILKHNMFPLSDILRTLFNYGTWGMGTQVEIEFAVNFSVPKGDLIEFAMLQKRPMVMTREAAHIEFKNIEQEEILCTSEQVLGDGVIDNIYDIILVDKTTFDRSKSKDVAIEISWLNEKLIKKNKQYILIGVGRWGSLDHWLGIPVSWEQISGAAVIIESSFSDFSVSPSQGSHFFHNITSFRIGYFTIEENKESSFVDWEWLSKQTAVEELEFTKHIRFKKPLITKISGQNNKGVIQKP
ncbi:MAG: histidine kinase [Melioribacteraceae bacterium]|nr:histidine kinase [Melioribacteraceae bacterium]